MKRLMFAAAFGAASATLAFAQAPAVKIGFISTFSGPNGILGQELLDGFKLGLKSTGGTIGGRAVELIEGDDQAKPDVGRQLADKMIESNRVQIITGPVFSSIMLALAKPGLDNGLPLRRHTRSTDSGPPSARPSEAVRGCSTLATTS